MCLCVHAVGNAEMTFLATAISMNHPPSCTSCKFKYQGMSKSTNPTARTNLCYFLFQSLCIISLFNSQGSSNSLQALGLILWGDVNCVAGPYKTHINSLLTVISILFVIISQISINFDPFYITFTVGREDLCPSGPATHRKASLPINPSVYNPSLCTGITLTRPPLHPTPQNPTRPHPIKTLSQHSNEPIPPISQSPVFSRSSITRMDPKTRNRRYSRNKWTTWVTLDRIWRFINYSGIDSMTKSWCYLYFSLKERNIIADLVLLVLFTPDVLRSFQQPIIKQIQAEKLQLSKLY